VSSVVTSVILHGIAAEHRHLADDAVALLEPGVD
jgi:hypothetical protein